MNLYSFATKEERLAYLRDNKKLVMTEKKASFKKADAISGFMGLSGAGGKLYSSKAAMAAEGVDATKAVQAKLVINACLLMDSHMDVHIPKLWNKSVKESKYNLLLQEHEMEFEKVIADAEDVVVSVQNISWADLNQPYPGKTECLVYDSTIEPDRNAFMYDQYTKGYVRQHSVGMRYVTVYMCVNSEEKYWAEEKANWDKYYPMVVNQDMADECGCFFAVTEAKNIEGSAVVLGSNCATPTMSIQEITEPSDDTQKHINDSRQPDTIDFSRIKLIN
jgi:hypothetical protein